jgi:hypothetical protein
MEGDKSIMARRLRWSYYGHIVRFGVTRAYTVAHRDDPKGLFEKHVGMPTEDNQLVHRGGYPDDGTLIINEEMYAISARREIAPNVHVFNVELAGVPAGVGTDFDYVKLNTRAIPPSIHCCVVWLHSDMV